MFKKRKVNKANLRKKEDEGASGASGDAEVMVNIAKGNVSSRGLSFNASSAKSSTVPLSQSVNIESDRNASAHVYAGDATHTIEIDTAIDRDHRSTLERVQAMKAASSDNNNDKGDSGKHDGNREDKGVSNGDVENGAKVYRGSNAYDTYTGKDVKQALSNNKATGTMGPLRAPAFLRATVAIDYQPNVCKDYKETGTVSPYIPFFLCFYLTPL